MTVQFYLIFLPGIEYLKPRPSLRFDFMPVTKLVSLASYYWEGRVLCYVPASRILTREGLALAISC